MGKGPQQAFSHQFHGTIWNTLVVPNSTILILETRDEKNFKTKFSALDWKNNKLLWNDLEFAEPWWIGMTAVNENILLLHTFVNKGNPDRKNLIAVDIISQKILWQVEDFSFSDWNNVEIKGHKTDSDMAMATVHLMSGELKEENWLPSLSAAQPAALKPQLYPEGTTHFDTLRKFMELRASVHLTGGAEYLEFEDLILISAYFQENGLANYLYVFTRTGEIVLCEKLGEKLQGLGVDTFFILAGCLFLVKNKSELVAFRVYD